MAREVLITLKRDGLPPRSEWPDFMAQYALRSWDATSDALAWATLAIIAQSDWDEQLERTMQQDDTEMYSLEMSFSGILRVYNDEGVVRGEDTPFRTYILGDTPIPLKVLGFPGGDFIPLIQIEYDGMRFWIDPLDTELMAHDEDFARQIELAGTIDYVEQDDTEMYSFEMSFSGILRVYNDEEIVGGEDAPFRTYNLGDTPIPLKVLGCSGGDSIPLIQIEYDGMRFWIEPLDTELVAHDEDFARQIELAVATGIPPGYKRQSIVPGEDTKTENVEISHRVYADRTKSQLGWLTRDYNTTSNTIFKVQSPVIGPDVRVELVVQHQEGTVGLGKYVVISFPAFIYLSDPEIMHQLKMQNLASQRLWNRSLAKHLTNEERAQMQRMAHLTEHNPERWQEDGRIVIAYAHLSEFGPYMFPGQVIDSADKVMIGITGKTGTKLHHLDLLEL